MLPLYSQTNDTTPYANSVSRDTIAKEMKDRLFPEEFILGLFPNTDGFLDGRLILNRNYLDRLTSGLEVHYTTKNDESYKEEVFKISETRKELTVQTDAVGMQFPFRFSDTIVSGFTVSCGGQYTHNDITASGYRIDHDDTVYFNTEKTIHTITPTIDLSWNLHIASMLELNTQAGYLAYMYINESGEKNYSTYDKPVEYTFTNTNSGYYISGTAGIVNTPIGDISSEIRFQTYGGDYYSKQVVVTGAYLTTIRSHDTFESRHIGLLLHYEITPLHASTSYTPIVTAGYTNTYEKLGDSVLFDSGYYYMGLMLKL